MEVEFLEVAERMLRAAPPKLGLSIDNLSAEVSPFQNQTGIFAKPVLWSQVRKLAGHIWWQKFGSQCPTLRWLAMRILPQTTSAAAAESAWSEFDYVFNRRRNRLSKHRASQLVYVHCNARLLRKFRSYKFETPYHPIESDSNESSDESDTPMDD